MKQKNKIYTLYIKEKILEDLKEENIKDFNFDKFDNDILKIENLLNENKVDNEIFICILNEYLLINFEYYCSRFSDFNLVLKHSIEDLKKELFFNNDLNIEENIKYISSDIFERIREDYIY